MFGRNKFAKYGNRKVKVAEGLTFDSVREKVRYMVLKERQELGEITGLEIHPRFRLTVDGCHICDYIADFRYLVSGAGVVIEDAKGFKTPDYIIKKKLVEALFQIQVVEV